MRRSNTYFFLHIIYKIHIISTGFHAEEGTREKRQVETFDADEYPTGTTSEGVEDEPSFWDRVVKIAIKLFSRFVEWLNT